jgi:hypothetical protein
MLKRIVSVVAVFLMMVSVCFAFQAGASAIAADIIVPIGAAPWWKGILNGFGAGLVAVFYGFAKNKDPQTGVMEKFDIQYAFPTMVVGGLVGVASFLLKVTPQDLATSLATSPIYGAVVFAADAVLKAIFRHSVPWLRDAINTIKGNPQG